MESRGLITIFVPSLGPGGVKRVMLNLCSGLEQTDYRVNIVTADASGPYQEEASELANLYDLSADGGFGTVRSLRRHLSNNPPDILISTHTHGNVTAFLSSIGSDITRIFTEHSLLSDRSHYVNTDIKDRLVNQLAKVVYPRTDAIVTVSEDVKSDIADFLGIPVDHARVIHNPVDLVNVRSQSQVPSGHPWLVDESIKAVLAAGRFDPRKDYCTLIDAMAQLDRDQDTKLILLGDGDEKSKIESRIQHHSLEDSVDLAGWVDNPYPYMSEADAFVLPSKSDGFGNVLVEALACGCPPVATRCRGGPREILLEGAIGELVPVGDATALVTGITTVMDSPPETELLEERATDFSIPTITDKYTELFTTL